MTRNDKLPNAPSRRSFLFVVTGAVGAMAVPLAVWPLIDQLNPDAASVANAVLYTDLGHLAPGERKIIYAEGWPIEIRARTKQEIHAARDTPLHHLRDRSSRSQFNPTADASDINRAASENGRLIVVVSVCTNDRVSLLSGEGNFGGWFCPVCGAHYDTSGWVREGPAPHNLFVPKHKFLADGRIQIDRTFRGWMN